MNHKQIVVKQMNEEATKLRSRLAELEAGIRVLGGTVNGNPSIQKRRSRGKGAASAPKPRNRSTAPADENLPAALVNELVAIKQNPNLSPIQKAQASRKARAKYRGVAAAPAPQGAVLSEAAAAS